jgi:hypothetical protein
MLRNTLFGCTPVSFQSLSHFSAARQIKSHPFAEICHIGRIFPFCQLSRFNRRVRRRDSQVSIDRLPQRISITTVNSAALPRLFLIAATRKSFMLLLRWVLPSILAVPVGAAIAAAGDEHGVGL